MKLYRAFQNELCTNGNIVLRATKIVVPVELRNRILDLGHEGHPGESSMKRRLREKVWWLKIDRCIEAKIKACKGCLIVSAPSVPEPMMRKSLPQQAWIDLALDFLGPLPSGHNLLVIIDYFSRYMEIEIMTNITAAETIERLSKIFCRLGFPKSITLDNARQFLSMDFETFCKNSNITLNKSTPYWPQQNGEVERQNNPEVERQNNPEEIKN